MNARQRRKVKRAAFRKYSGVDAIDIGWHDFKMPIIGNCVMPILISGREGPRWWQKKKKA